MLQESAPFTCPQCRATLPRGETCRERFDLCMAKELENADSYGAVHHLSVPCYMLQHNAYSKAGWLYTREALRRFVRDGIPPSYVRQHDGWKLDSGNRTWRVTRGPKLRGVEDIAWESTIAGVRLDTAEHYCADVRWWAENVLVDSEWLVTTVGWAG